MATVLSYPASNYVPEPGLWTSSSLEVRKNLSKTSLVLFFNMMKLWKVRDDDAKLLLGGITNGPFYEMKKNPEDKVLDIDQMFRVSIPAQDIQGHQHPARPKAGG